MSNTLANTNKKKLANYNNKPKSKINLFPVTWLLEEGSVPFRSSIISSSRLSDMRTCNNIHVQY